MMFYYNTWFAQTPKVFLYIVSHELSSFLPNELKQLFLSFIHHSTRRSASLSSSCHCWSLYLWNWVTLLNSKLHLHVNSRRFQGKLRNSVNVSSSLWYNFIRRFDFLMLQQRKFNLITTFFRFSTTPRCSLRHIVYSSSSSHRHACQKLPSPFFHRLSTKKNYIQVGYRSDERNIINHISGFLSISLIHMCSTINHNLCLK